MSWFGAGCCQVGGCETFSDDFEREDSTDLGNQWIEWSGDWSISSGYLTEGGTAGAVVIKDDSHGWAPGVVGSVHGLDQIANGDKVRVIGNHSGGVAGSYYFAEFERGATTCYLRIGSSSGGSETIHREQSFQTSGLDLQILYLCMTPIFISAHIESSPNYPIWICTDDYDEDKKWGVGNGGSGDIAVDDWSIIEYHSQAKPECPECICVCDNNSITGCLPWQLTCTVTRTPDGQCDDIHGASCTLEYDWASMVWQGVIEACSEDWEGDGSHPGIEWTVTFSCRKQEGDLSGKMTLRVDPNALEPWECLGVPDVEPSYKLCDPIHIEFGPFTIETDPPVLCDCCPDGESASLTFVVSA